MRTAVYQQELAAYKQIVSNTPMATKEENRQRTHAQIGKRLSLSRRALDLTQIEFAERAGLQQSAYSQYETGGKRPSVDTANALCDTYSLTLDWIFRGDPSGLPYRLHSAIGDLKKR